MAQIVNVVITDDLDGTPDAETVTFSLGGTAYEIDLAAGNAARLRAGLQPFLDAARPAPRARQARAVRSPGARADRAAVRAWAAEQGLQVSERGRISAEVMRKYEAAH